jgi:hypothetical protein
MKALPVKFVYAVGYFACPIEEATHVKIHIPGPAGELTLPVIRHGTRQGTNCWTWNGSIDAPTLKPSVLSQGYNGDSVKYRCHTWINDGKAIFLDDCSHELKGQTLDLLDVKVDT